MKEIVSAPLGEGKVGLGISEGMLVATVGYPVEKILEPIKTQFVDKLKALIPGTWDDALIDAAWADAVKLLSETKV